MQFSGGVEVVPSCCFALLGFLFYAKIAVFFRENTDGACPPVRCGDEAPMRACACECPNPADTLCCRLLINP